MRSKIASEGRGFSVLHIKADYDMHSLDTTGLSSDEYRRLHDNSSSTDEYIDDPDQPNIMLTGLLTATGAQIVREDVDSQATQKLYKGMLDEKPVYIKEFIGRRVRNEDDGKKTVFERRAWVETELTAHDDLNRLSTEDWAVLHSLGAQPGTEYESGHQPDRSRLVEIVRLYDAAIPIDADKKLPPGGQGQS